MRLLEVNGRSLLGATHQEAVNALRSCGYEIQLAVCKGYDRAEVEKAIMEGRLVREPKSTPSVTSGTPRSSLSHSVSSLDREDDDMTTVNKHEQQMKQELVEWEREDQEKRLRERIEHVADEDLTLVEARPKSTPEKVNFQSLLIQG